SASRVNASAWAPGRASARCTRPQRAITASCSSWRRRLTWLLKFMAAILSLAGLRTQVAHAHGLALRARHLARLLHHDRGADADHRLDVVLHTRCGIRISFHLDGE